MEWNEACKKIIYNPRDREGIGRLGEKTVHAVLKYYLESDESCHEQKVEGFYADILQPD